MEIRVYCCNIRYADCDGNLGYGQRIIAVTEDENVFEVVARVFRRERWRRIAGKLDIECFNDTQRLTLQALAGFRNQLRWRLIRDASEALGVSDGNS